MTRRERNGGLLIGASLLVLFGVAGAADLSSLTPGHVPLLILAALIGRHGLHLTETD